MARAADSALHTQPGAGTDAKIRAKRQLFVYCKPKKYVYSETFFFHLAFSSNESHKKVHKQVLIVKMLL